MRQGTIDERLAQLGTNRKELKASFQISFPYLRVNNKTEEQDFLQKIFSSPYTPVLLQRAQEKRELLLKYFEQEGVTDNTPTAMVDVGWLGTSRLMLNTILRQTGFHDTLFYYYGIRGDVFPPSAGKYVSFFQCGELSTEGTALIENYFSASPYPTTIGYKLDADVVSPIFPDGTQYEENDIIKANLEVSEWMSKEIQRSRSTEKTLHKIWAKQAIRILTHTDTDINLTPMLSNYNFDKVAFVKRLSLKELVELVFMGKHITAFDRGSMRLTLPKAFWRIAWKMHEKTGNVRRRLYLKYYNG